MDGFIDDNPVFTSEEVKVIDIIVMVSSSLGMVGSLFMMITFALFKEIREFSTKLICLLALSDFLAALAWFPFTHKHIVPCFIQAASLQFFLCASFLWTMAISISLFLAFYPNLLEREASLKMRYYHLICWGLPFIFVGITLLFSKYENNGVRCFIDTSNLVGLLFYLPLLIVVIVNLVIFVAIRLQLARHKGTIESKTNVMVSFYSVSFLASQLPAVINGIQHYSNPKHPVFGLFVVLSALQPLQGFLNAIVYGLNEGFISQYIYFFEKYCGRRFRKGERYERDEVATDNLLEEYNYHSDDE